MKSEIDRLFAGALKSAFVTGGIGRLLTQVIAFATVIIASAYLDLTQFGFFALASALALIATSLLYSGLYEALVRSRDPDQDSGTVLTLCLIGGAAFTGAIALVGFALGGRDSLEGSLFLLLAFVPLIASPAVWAEALLTRQQRIRTVVACTLLAEFAGFVVMVIGFLYGAEIFALGFARIVASIVSTGLKLIALSRRPALEIRLGRLRSIGSTALPVAGVTSLKLFSNYGADLIIGLFLSPAAVGAYRAASRIATTGADIVLQPMHAISWARFTRLEREETSGKMAETWLSQIRFVLAVAWPALGVLAVSSPFIVGILLPETWGSVAAVLTVLTLARAIEAVDTLTTPVFVCLGRSRQLLIIRVIGGIFLLVAILLFVEYGPVAVAWAIVLASGVVVIAGVTVTMVALGITPFQLAGAIAPGGILTCASVGALVFVAPMDQGVNLLVASSGLALSVAVWMVAFLVLLGRGVLRIPEA